MLRNWFWLSSSPGPEICAVQMHRDPCWSVYLVQYSPVLTHFRQIHGPRLQPHIYCFRMVEPLVQTVVASCSVTLNVPDVHSAGCVSPACAYANSIMSD